jgi:hypothetical protein
LSTQTFYNAATNAPKTPTASSATTLISRSFAPPVLTTLAEGVDNDDLVTTTEVVVVAWVLVAVAVAVAVTLPVAVEQTGLATRLVRLGQAESAELSSEEWAL